VVAKLLRIDVGGNYESWKDLCRGSSESKIVELNMGEEMQLPLLAGAIHGTSSAMLSFEKREQCLEK
jgi:hypothetical protein